jgi:hypothetical protein
MAARRVESATLCLANREGCPRIGWGLAPYGDRCASDKMRGVVAHRCNADGRARGELRRVSVALGLQPIDWVGPARRHFAEAPAPMALADKFNLQPFGCSKQCGRGRKNYRFRVVNNAGDGWRPHLPRDALVE